MSNVVRLDAGRKGGEAVRLGRCENPGGGIVVEAVPEEDDPGGGKVRQLGGQPVERVAGLVGGQQRAALTRQPLRPAEVEVRDAEESGPGPPERAAGTRDDRHSGKGEGKGVHDRVMPEAVPRRKHPARL